MSQYITRDEAQSEIGRLVKEQLEAFSAQGEVIAEQSRRLEEQSREARDTLAKLAIEVDAVLKSNKTDCEAQIAQQVGDRRTDAQAAVTAVNAKIADIEELFKAKTSSQEDADLKLVQHVAGMVELESKLRMFAQGVESNLGSIQQEVVRTQAESSRTQAGISNLIETARSEGGSVLRPNQERDRQVFDPRDYKIEALPSSISLGVWKKWRHEVEIYVDTIGPTWKGVKLILQQARHSSTALQPSDQGLPPDSQQGESSQQRHRPSRRALRLLSQGLGPLQDARAQAELGLVHRVQELVSRQRVRALAPLEPQVGPATRRLCVPLDQRPQEARAL